MNRFVKTIISWHYIMLYYYYCYYAYLFYFLFISHISPRYANGFFWYTNRLYALSLKLIFSKSSWPIRAGMLFNLQNQTFTVHLLHFSTEHTVNTALINTGNCVVNRQVDGAGLIVCVTTLKFRWAIISVAFSHLHFISWCGQFVRYLTQTFCVKNTSNCFKTLIL